MKQQHFTIIKLLNHTLEIYMFSDRNSKICFKNNQIINNVIDLNLVFLVYCIN